MALAYRSVHANLAEAVVQHGVKSLLVPLLLLPQSLHNLQQLLLLNATLEVYPEWNKIEQK